MRAAILRSYKAPLDIEDLPDPACPPWRGLATAAKEGARLSG